MDILVIFCSVAWFITKLVDELIILVKAGPTLICKVLLREILELRAKFVFITREVVIITILTSPETRVESLKLSDQSYWILTE